MNARETIESIRSSGIWDSLSHDEKLDAITYALHVTGCCDRFSGEVTDVIGETYGG